MSNIPLNALKKRKDKAAELEAFTAKAEGEAGAATKARRKERQEAEETARKEKEQQDKHRNETDQDQVTFALLEQANVVWRTANNPKTILDNAVRRKEGKQNNS